MPRHDYPRDLIAAQRKRNRVYEALAAPRPHHDPTQLRRSLLQLSSHLMWHPYWKGCGRGPGLVELCRQARTEDAAELWKS
ncbi:hypothetical protein [Streptomyces smyrnaeus]|uniref:hypothetical protein n=1 Tax=Streptomyces smyrnaeus TaxID=1387713 RepID=UPI0036E3F735